jgi:hypothetical protein
MTVALGEDGGHRTALYGDLATTGAQRLQKRFGRHCRRA